MQWAESNGYENRGVSLISHISGEQRQIKRPKMFHIFQKEGMNAPTMETSELDMYDLEVLALLRSQSVHVGQY